jgi:hypothetical protein
MGQQRRQTSEGHRADQSIDEVQLALAIVAALEEPLYRAAAISGTLAAHLKRPSESEIARYAVGIGRRTCAELRRRRRGVRKRRS